MLVVRMHTGALSLSPSVLRVCSPLAEAEWGGGEEEALEAGGPTWSPLRQTRQKLAVAFDLCFRKVALAGVLRPRP